MFYTETDTETVAQLVDLNLKRGMRPAEAAQACLSPAAGRLRAGDDLRRPPELMIGARHGAPLAVGFGDDEMFLGSDSLALAPLTRRIAYLRDGDWAVLSRGGAEVFDADGTPVPSRSATARCPATRSARTATGTTWRRSCTSTRW